MLSVLTSPHLGSCQPSLPLVDIFFPSRNKSSDDQITIKFLCETNICSALKSRCCWLCFTLPPSNKLPLAVYSQALASGRLTRDLALLWMRGHAACCNQDVRSSVLFPTDLYGGPGVPCERGVARDDFYIGLEKEP